MKLRLENLPPSLHGQREVLSRCLDAFNQLTPVLQVYLFGSHARGDARLDSDVDLCIVAEGAERQQETARRYREAIWDIWPRPALTLIPIAPARLAEKQAIGDHFFASVLKEGVLLASEN
ncbi:MAG TPA: nucleotidyltransferase domain-containing protein [Candidatus Paceibacterota bacterium]|nr:nucleotidyltransferase domain-containing protein [Candidatus Paceibacterota bacterium]